MTSTDLPNKLRRAALRATRPRLAVLAAVHENPHADTEALIRAVHADDATVSRQSVYNCLHVLAAAGLVRRIQPAGSPARYESRMADNHHHMVCRGCGAISDVDCVVGAAPCLTSSDHSGFAVDEAEVVFWGRCPACSS